MTNGFYDSKTLDVDLKEEIIESAIKLAYCVRCEVKYKNNVMNRCIDTELTIAEMIAELKDSFENTLDVIDRNAYNQGVLPHAADQGEVCWSSTYNKNTKREHWVLLYCDLTLANLQKLINIYSLKLIQW